MGLQSDMLVKSRAHWLLEIVCITMRMFDGIVVTATIVDWRPTSTPSTLNGDAGSDPQRRPADCAHGVHRVAGEAIFVGEYVLITCSAC